MAALSALHSTCPQDCFHEKHLLWRKRFSNCISHFGRIFFRFRQIFSSTVVRTALIFRFINRINANFLRILRKSLIIGLSELHYVSTRLFSSEATSLKKTLFSLYFTFWVETFQVFEQILCCTVVRTALDSRLIIGIMSIYFELCANYVSWSVRSALQVSTGLCLWEASSLKKKHFSNCISVLRRKHFRFSANLFQHGSQNCIGF